MNERQATESDKKWLWVTYKELLKPYVESQWGWDEDFQFKGFYDNYDLSNYRIIEVGSEPIAAYYIIELEDHIHLRMLLVVKTSQNIGVGTNVVAKLQASAESSNRYIKLSVIKSNPAGSFYSKLGFSSVETDEGCNIYRWSP